MQVCRGVQAMHSNTPPLAHRDIKVGVGTSRTSDVCYPSALGHPWVQSLEAFEPQKHPPTVLNHLFVQWRATLRRSFHLVDTHTVSKVGRLICALL